MAYTILQVEKLTGISSHTLRFWAKKGLFPLVYKDDNLIKYFSDKDVEWARWIDYLRKSQMDIKSIKEYIDLAIKGESSTLKRHSMIKKQREILANNISNLQEVLQKLDDKIRIYDSMLNDGKDGLNPESKEYIGCSKDGCL